MSTEFITQYIQELREKATTSGATREVNSNADAEPVSLLPCVGVDSRWLFNNRFPLDNVRPEEFFSV